MQKLSISMPPDLAERVRDVVSADGMTLSAFMAQAAEDALRRRAMRIAVDEYQREHGWFTPEEIAVADAQEPVVVGPASREPT
jgi:predicted transcriptional regulator